jgi:DNA-binding CsgD family transcriptional regulator
MTSGSLDAAGVRSLLRLLGELRELGRNPPRWRRHLVDSLGTLCGARAVLAGELAVVGPGKGRDSVRVIHRELRGIGAADERRFDEEVVWQTHGPNDVISGQWPQYGHRFTVGRHQLVDNRRWYRSAVANEQFRSFDCDDFMVSMVPVPALRALSSIKMFRAWKDRPFSERDCLLVELLTEELARDWAQVAADAGEVALGRRLRQVLTLLSGGASEKEVAAALALSTHTVHDYTKALYRAFKVRSRSELLARIARPRLPRIYLVSETP